MKFISIILLGVGFMFLIGCGGSENHDALTYATFATAVNEAIPGGLKESVVSESAILLKNTLEGECSADYTDCPYITAAGGGDEVSVQILMRLWGLDYGSECTDELLSDGTCFECIDCTSSTDSTVKFIMPTMIASPSECWTASTMDARYVNFGVDPCFFDSTIAQITNIKTCETVMGGDVDISSIIPWYASWGIPQMINFSSYFSSESGGGVWWTVNEGALGNSQYFLSLDSNWLYAGIKDFDNDQFMFFGSGSLSYFESIGSEGGVNISAYAGTLSTIPASFEAIQVRDDTIDRIKSNGSHLWYQSWLGEGNFPETPDDVDSVKNTPIYNRCLEIGDTITTSKYAPLADCVASFGKEDVTDLNNDDNFILKIIDGETAGLIDFSANPTSSTATTCLQ